MTASIRRPRHGLRLALARRAFTAVALLASIAPSQAIAQDDLPVAPQLQALDRLLGDQLTTWSKECDRAAAAHGRESAEWFTTCDSASPIAVHGSRLLEYARSNPGTPESFICLTSIVDWEEGGGPTCQLAFGELLQSHQDNPALSWLCMRCTNALYLNASERFLTSLREKSAHPTVQAAAALNLARLYDNAAAIQHNLATIRRNFDKAGMLTADPSLHDSLDELQRRSPAILTTRRDEMLKLIGDKYPSEKPWDAKYTWARLNFAFQKAKPLTTYGELAAQLAYDVKNLRVGCIAPAFEAIDIDSRPVNLTEHRGKPVLLMFSFKGCGACESMYPTLRKLHKQYSSDEFLLLGIMADQTIDTVHQPIAAGDVTWRCIWDSRSGPIHKLYRPDSYPTVLLLNKDGRIVSTSLRREEDLLPAIERLVKQQP